MGRTEDVGSVGVTVFRIVLAISGGFLLLYAVRHYTLALWRLAVRPPAGIGEATGYHLPQLTVLLPMHNEEKVAGDILQALLECDYDWDRLQIVAINDRSTDGTAEIIDGYGSDFDVIQAVHIDDGPGGKAAALKAATPYATGEILLVFDADYVPGRTALKMLVAPFADAQVGAVMGRVVPHNATASQLAGMLSLERSAGYQGGQQSRWGLLHTAQYGGTAGGVRASALEAAGGWDELSLTEDTDLTCRLILGGWRVVYVNRAECYEEVPERWPVRRRQLERWVIGHTRCLHRYWRPLLASPLLGGWQKLDAMFMLCSYWTAPAAVAAWLASLALLFCGDSGALAWLPVAALITGFQLFSGQAAFVEMGTTALLDGLWLRVLLLPLEVLNFFSSTVTVCGALLRYYMGGLGGRPGTWHRTERSRVMGISVTPEGGSIGTGGAFRRQSFHGSFRPARAHKVFILAKRKVED
jgi:cellulose synthase/poly-beta-1,6-N-acetylglucosamine synthase-like glycosyltransferase